MRLLTGLLFWLATGIGAWWMLTGPQKLDDQANQQLVAFLTHARHVYEAEFERSSALRIGDPIIVMDGQTAKVIGSVSAVSDRQTNLAVWTKRAQVQFYGSTPELNEGDYLTYHHTPATMDWVVQMMLPPHKRKEIADLIGEAYRKHYSEIADAMQPVVLQSVKDASDVIRQDFYASIQQRRRQIEKLGNRYQVELVDQELVPLIEDEIWPIVQSESQPLASQIGEEMFQQASVWRFGWRFLYDRSPLPQRNLVKKEFDRFMVQHGAPIIKKHIPDFLDVQQSVLRRISNNQKVKNVVSSTTMKILRDPECQTLITDILRDVFVDNEKLQHVFESNWKSEAAVRALKLTNQRLDPTITRIGQSLFGSPEQSITPEFSRILRNRILHKDDRWLVLHRTSKSTKQPLAGDTKIAVKPGFTGTENPFHVPARTNF